MPEEFSFKLNQEDSNTLLVLLTEKVETSKLFHNVQDQQKFALIGMMLASQMTKQCY